MSQEIKNAKTKILTPYKAMKAYCYWCSGDDKGNVAACPSKDCPLYPYRFGTEPNKDTDDGTAIKRPLKAMRARCLDCTCFDAKEVRVCDFDNCPLHPYRMGKRPEETATQRKPKGDCAESNS